MNQVTGGCLCGDVRIMAAGDPNRVGLCHCLDCRKHHGALFYAAAIFPQDAVTVEGETRDYAGRHFCPRCGSSVFARAGDEVEVHLGAWVVMAAIPFSLIGILPAHWAFGAFFTATSMIGFMAGAGIVVRNSIILVDFIERALEEYDHVIFDSGPLLVVSETVALAPRVDGVVTVVSKHIEFGQGNHAGLAAMAAEELGADWSKVRVEQATSTGSRPRSCTGSCTGFSTKSSTLAAAGTVSKRVRITSRTKVCSSIRASREAANGLRSTLVTVYFSSSQIQP